MSSTYSEEEVHNFIYSKGLEALIDDCPEIDAEESAPESIVHEDFALWRVIKARAIEKIARAHSSVRYGDLVGSKIKLPTDKTKPMELDMLGQHENGIFVLELKVEKSAERNAFSELFAYSNYLSEMFALAGAKDIANVLVAKVDAKITRSAYLYDLLIADRNTVVYRPIFGASLEETRLQLHLPSDEDFRFFANELLGHERMACLVVSFHDLPGWFDSDEDGGSVNDYTRDHLSKLSSYAAQLMEAERLHGFCFIRKRWKELNTYYENSLVICAINPFGMADTDRATSISAQLAANYRASFFEFAELGFDGRLFEVGRRAIKDGLTHNFGQEFETAVWAAMVNTGIETVFTHNFGFCPTGVFREAYTAYLNSLYAAQEEGEDVEDVSTLKINEIGNWFHAWQFMEMCGFKQGESLDDESEA